MYNDLAPTYNQVGMSIYGGASPAYSFDCKCPTARRLEFLEEHHEIRTQSFVILLLKIKLEHYFSKLHKLNYLFK